jgi:hypothetical protein
MRFLRALRDAAASRALPPLLIGFFFLVYLSVAFSTDEALVTLMDLTRGSLFLKALLALIPLNCACRLAAEGLRYLARRRSLTGNAAGVQPELFDETVVLPASPLTAELEGRLASLGYRTRRNETALAAWRGCSAFAARALFLTGTFCLFAGILISLTARNSERFAVIEGEPLPFTPSSGRVERINLRKSTGPFLEKTLTVEVAPVSGGGSRVFSLYPPALYQGAFVYPRYLGIAPLIRFAAPDLPNGYEAYGVLNIYPAGKEDNVEIPGTPYHLSLSIAEPDGGNEPYLTGRMTFLFKLLKGKELLLSGSAPLGGEFARDGYRVGFPGYRRMVFTDYIRDYGVMLVWTSALLFIAAFVLWLPVRLFLPRQEMLFLYQGGVVSAHSRAEGGARRHAGVFHEALDMVQARESAL